MPALTEDCTALGPATVRVTRKSAPWRDRLRPYKVVIDGTVKGTVRNGETRDFTVPSGHHEVRMRIDWTGSNPSSLDIEAGQVALFVCEPAGSTMTSVVDVLSALRKKGRPWIDLHQVPSNTNASTNVTPSKRSTADASSTVDTPATESTVDLRVATGGAVRTSSAAAESGWWPSSDRRWYPPGPPPGWGEEWRSPPDGTNGCATASLVLGILWIGGVGSLLALVLGYVGKDQIDRSAGKQSGRGLAVSGIVLGWIGVVLLVLILILVSVASVNPKEPTTTTPSVSTAAHTYLYLISPVNVAAATFASQAAHWNSATTDSQAVSEAQPAVSALESLRKSLLDRAWPAGAQRDIKALAAAVVPVITDLDGLATLNIAGASAWETMFAGDVARMRAVDDAVRHELGLPPASSGSGQSGGTGTTTLGGSSSSTPGTGTAPPSTSGGTTTPGGTASGNGGGGTGGAACFGCVTITTVTWAVYPGPDIPSEYRNCISATSTVTSNAVVIGPQVANPNREFTYSVQYTNGCRVTDGTEFTLGKVDLQGADPLLSIVTTNPSVPFALTPGSSQELAVNFRALEGNVYDGPLVIDVIVD
jgi:hypothetical protein